MEIQIKLLEQKATGDLQNIGNSQKEKYKNPFL